tara:strand:- start:474 stop:1310 length:837 start_codon:yes stop_codon:yes gene_type:complete
MVYYICNQEEEMPRVTYAHRLQTLLSKPLSDYDKGFAESLSNYYNQRKSLTAGRAAAVKRLEERYSDENLAKAAANPVIERLAALELRVDPGTWDAGFLESVTLQCKRGRDLSEKQLTIVSTIEGRWSDQAIEDKKDWKQTYSNSPELKLKAKIVASYYYTTGYYRDLALNILEKPDFIPTPKQYKNITSNKFATKVLEAWHADPKYEVGAYIALRSTAPGVLRQYIKGVGVILKSNADYPKCAARGTKLYQVLPFGSPTPVLVEERYIKNARIGGSK